LAQPTAATPEQPPTPNLGLYKVELTRYRSRPATKAGRRGTLYPRQSDVDILPARCAAGDDSMCEFLAQTSCQSGELFACRALAENGEPAAWIDYRQLLCDRGRLFLRSLTPAVSGQFPKASSPTGRTIQPESGLTQAAAGSGKRDQATGR
jgi:hypothetical protein